MPRTKKRAVKGRKRTTKKAKSTKRAVNPTEREDGTKLDMETSRIIAAIGYIIGIFAIIPYLLVEKENKFVRFHAIQATILGAVWIGLWVIAAIISLILGVIPILGWILISLLWLGYYVLVIVAVVYLAFKAYMGDKYEIPWIADLAEKYV